ncbi:hypothetical protein ACWGOQ_0020095 [Aquimarina sp. M1]
MKNHNLNLAILCLLIILVSCSKEEITTEESQVNEELPFEKSIVYQGETLAAGYGYNPLNDRPFYPAFKDIQIDRENISENKFNTNLSIIRTNEDLTKFIEESETSDQTTLGTDQLRLSTDLRTTLSREVKIDKETIYVVSRISLRDKVFSLNSANSYELDDFSNVVINYLDGLYFETYYGPGFIEKQVTGADVLFLYSFNLSTVSETIRKEINRILSVKIGKIFGEETDETITTEENQVISNSIASTKAFSNVSGFIPQPVNNTSELNQELERLTEYLTINPDKASPQETIITSYAKVTNSNKTEENFNRVKKCIDDLNSWYKIESRILDVISFTESDELRTKAQTVLTTIQNEIRNSQNCNGSRTPADNEYEDITL